MPYFQADFSVPVDPAMAATQLAELCPDLRILGDYYHLRIQKIRKTIRECEEAGTPLHDPELPIAEIERVQAENGPSIAIQLKLEGSYDLNGRLDDTGLLVSTTRCSEEDLVSDAHLKALIAALRQLFPSVQTKIA